MKREYVYKGFERFWHWAQALLVIFLALTGFEIHGSFTFFGFEQAVRYHNTAALALVLLIVFAVFWHVTTGEWRQYLPTRAHLRAQVDYYLTGIFRNAPHPTRKTALAKLNPLQKMVYALLKVVAIPVMVTSGLLFLFFRSPESHAFLHLDSVGVIAVIHTAGAFFLVAFLAIHVYLITTGRTVTSNLKAMITGFEELEGEGGDRPSQHATTESAGVPS